MKLTLSKILKHFALVTRHKWQVFKNCCKCGIVWRGIVHDISKFSPTEFFESARYYQGNRSPISVCRKEEGRSLAWLHHKGRNRHHIEYWFDSDCAEHPVMPYKFAVECICDKLAATKTYLKSRYDEEKPLLHWRKYGCTVIGNPKTLRFVERVFVDLSEHGEKYILNKAYMKKVYAEICEGQKDNGEFSEELPL